MKDVYQSRSSMMRDHVAERLSGIWTPVFAEAGRVASVAYENGVSEIGNDVFSLSKDAWRAVAETAYIPMELFGLNKMVVYSPQHRGFVPKGLI